MAGRVMSGGGAVVSGGSGSGSYDAAGAAASAQTAATAAAATLASAAQANAIAAAAPRLAYTTPKTSAFTFTAGQITPVNLAADITGTLPSNPPDGTQCAAYVRTFAAGKVLTIAAGAGDTIEQTGGTTGPSVTRSAGAGQSAWLIFDAADRMWLQIADRLPLSLLTGLFDAAGAAATAQATASTAAATALSNAVAAMAATPLKIPAREFGVSGSTAPTTSSPVFGINGLQFAKGTSSQQTMTILLDLDPSWVNVKVTLVWVPITTTNLPVKWQVQTLSVAAGQVLVAGSPVSGTGWNVQTKTVSTGATAFARLETVLTSAGAGSNSIPGYTAGQKELVLAITRLDNDAADTYASAVHVLDVIVEPV